jgi:translation initiation factor 3 subunit B
MSDPIEAALQKIKCGELEKLQSLYPQFDFEDEIKAKPELAEFLRVAVQKHAMVVVDPLTLNDAPKLNDDFSNYFVINNLPKCKEEKLPKLITLIETSLKKKNLKVEPADIDIPINPATSESDGVAFVKMSNEENAR